MIHKHEVEFFIKDCGLNVIGIKDKIPFEGKWKQHQEQMREPQIINAPSLAVICGKVSGNLECLDIDLKNDITKSLYNRLKKKVSQRDPKLLSKMLIIKTPSGGYHWVYRCKKIEGNIPDLARRESTLAELKLKPRERVKVLIETRGEGGYIATNSHIREYRTDEDKYKIVHRDFDRISEISEAEREIIFNITKENKGETTWADFNSRGDIRKVLMDADWTSVKVVGDLEYWRRPGDTTAIHSGNHSISRKCFTCFSSSTELIPGKSYSTFALYFTLHHNGDFRRAASVLRSDGFGDAVQEKEENFIDYSNSRNEEGSKIKDIKEVDISEYLSNYETDYDYLNSIRDNTLAKGLSTGSPMIDEYFLWKPGKYTVCVGHTSTGKTLSILWLTLISALKHDWKICVIAKENSSGDLKRKLCEFYLQKPLQHSTSDEFQESLKWVSDHYTFIRGRGGLVKTLRDAISLMYSMVEQKKGGYNLFFIDPYSGFDLDRINGETTHEMNYRLNGELLDFTEKTGVSVFMSLHTVTSSRRVKGDDGYLLRPTLDHAEGGSCFGNRADVALIFHRVINHDDPAEKFTTDMYVDKDRDLESGGAVTPISSPIRLRLRDYRFFVNETEDVVYNIKNANKNPDYGKNLKLEEVVDEEIIPF
jgi:hypothetical protein